MKTTVSFQLSQADKKGLRTIQTASYQYDGKVKLNIEKVAQSVANSVFRKLDAQNSSSINFGIKTSRPFNMTITVDNIKVLDIDECMNSVTDNSKLKIKAKKYKEDPKEAKSIFINDIVHVVTEANAANADYNGCIEIAKPKNK